MKNKKLRLLVILSIVLVIQVGIAAALFISAHNQEDPTQPPVLQQPETQTPAENDAPVPVTEAEETTVPATEPPATETQPPETTPPTEAPKPPKPERPVVPAVTEPPALEFPYAIPGTDLVIQKVDSYDGIFLEDGSDQNVTGICAMVLVNTGSTGVEYANISLNQKGTILEFQATVIPAGATVVVQEYNAAPYRNVAFTGCSADVAVAESFEMSVGVIEVKENADGSLQVTNLTDKTIPCVRVFYKFALEKGSVYVGGITYTAKVVDLAPGASQRLIPSHYAAGSSEIVMVRTYDTAD